jgi:putative chitinase
LDQLSLALLGKLAPDAALGGGQIELLKEAATEANINSPRRLAMWLAQLGVESANFTRFEECLNYSASGLLATWPRHFDAPTAAAYAHQPQKIANRAYALRNGNGDEASGDGFKYRGRGAVQVTGYTNYSLCGSALGLDLRGSPDLAAGAARFRVAVWYWGARGLNRLADAGDVIGATKAINGGTNGLAERQALYASAMTLLSSS